jgi:ribosomal protein S18 acetylase RimI-like enzyme
MRARDKGGRGLAEVSIRPGTVADAEAVERLRVAGWRQAYRGIIPDAVLDTMPVNVQRRRAQIAQPPAGVLETVAVRDGAIVGWLAAGPSRDEDRRGPDEGEIYACYVLPQQWRGGVGSLLMAHGTEALAAAGHGDITLWVLEANARARRFYEAFGFHPDGGHKLLDFGALVPEVRYRRPAAAGREPA